MLKAVVRANRTNAGDHADRAPRRRTDDPSRALAPTPDGAAPAEGSILRNVLANMPSQNVVDEGLVPHPALACFLAELIEHSGVDTNRNELTRCVAEWRAAHAPHGLQLRRR